jgi:signal transduction histidine kinase
VDNALKYGGDALTKIEVRWAETESHFRLSVTDDGVGIDMENPDRIFGLFQRHETAKGVEGTGLGLAIVKAVAEQHGGLVWVEPAPTRGTTFHVTFAKYR